MEYYNEFKLTMETNAKAKEASEILINRLNKGFEIDNTYPSRIRKCSVVIISRKYELILTSLFKVSTKYFT